MDKPGQNENNEGLDEGFESNKEEFAGTTLEELQAYTGLVADKAEKDAGGNTSKLETVEKAEAELRTEESVEEMGASDNEAMEEIEEQRDEEEMGPEKEQSASAEATADKKEGKESEEVGATENLEADYEEMVNGEAIVESAEALLGGNSKELCQYATDKMSGGEKELMGKLYYDWVKNIVPIREKFLKDVRGKLKSGATAKEAKDSSKEAAEIRVAKMQGKAAGSVAATVFWFLIDLKSSSSPALEDSGGNPLAANQVEELWEENRESAQAEFDKGASSGGLAAEGKWFDLMYEKYGEELAKGRTMEAMKSKGGGEMQQLQNDLDEQGVNLDDWLKRSKAVNLLRYVTDSKYSSGDRLNVQLKGEGGKDITDVDGLIGADGANKLDMVLKPKGELTVDEVVQCINETPGMPDAIASGGEVKLSAKISIDQGKQLFNAMKKKRLIKRNNRG